MSLTKVTYSMVLGASVNVLDFGADPTGVADSTAAITLAATAAQYKILYFPAGIYAVSALTIPSFSHWVGDGSRNSIIKPIGTVTEFINMNGVQRVEIDGLWINGDNGATGTAVHGLAIFNSSYINIHDNEFSGLTGKGVLCEGSSPNATQYITVERNNMAEWRSPVQFDSCGVALYEGTAYSNVLYNNFLQASYHGVLCQGRDFNAVGGGSKAHKIVGNTINSKLAYGVALYETNPILSISNVTDNGGGRIRVTTTSASPFTTGMTVFIRNVGGATQANGQWIITAISSTQIDLDGSVYSSAYTSGGVVIPTEDNQHLVDGNTIYDMVGAVIEGASGTGIYVLANGNVRVSNNHCYNTNISTTNAAHASGGIGIGSSYGETVVVGNLIERCNWHGIYVATCLQGKTTVTGNTVRWNKKNNIFVSDSKGVVVSSNIVYGIRDTSSRGIYVQGTNVEAEFTGICEGLVISDNQISTFTNRGVEVIFAKNFTITGNSLINIGGDNEGFSFVDCDQGTVVSNVSDMKTSTECPMLILRCTNTRVSANSLIGSSGGSFSAFLNGTCTNTLFDETNSMSRMAAYNGSTGGNMHTRGTSAPTNAARQVGDIHWNTAAVAAGTIAWVTTTAGDPPTWKTWGTIAS